jgi:hypothetical protein
MSKTTSTLYNLDGSTAQVTYPSGSVVVSVYNPAGQPITLTDTTHNINYASGAVYAPQGALATLTLGNTTTFAGITESDQYNKRLQPSLISAASPSATLLSLTYNYGLGTNDNGNVLAITNNKTTARSQTFTYTTDGLNRLAKAVSGTTWGANFSPLRGSLLFSRMGQPLLGYRGYGNHLRRHDGEPNRHQQQEPVHAGRLRLRCVWQCHQRWFSIGVWHQRLPVERGGADELRQRHNLRL